MINSLRFLKIFGLAYPFFICMDIIWIGFIMNGVYKEKLSAIARMSNGAIRPNIPASLLVWLLIVGGSLVFVLPQIESAPLIRQFMWGAFYGLILYGVYDLTNFAILSSWPLSITMLDLAWGMFANGILAIVLVFLSKLIQH